MQKILCAVLIFCTFACGNLLSIPRIPRHDNVPVEDLSNIEPQQMQDEEGAIVLATFSGMVNNFANILSDPHNPTVVGPNLAHMLAGIINIALTATRRGDLAADATEEEIIEYFRLHEVEKKVRAHLIQRAHQLRNNLCRTED